MQIHRQTFGSLVEWLAFLETPTTMPLHERVCHNVGDSKWYGTGSYDAAIRLAEDGWEEGLTRLHKLSVELSDELIGLLHIPEVQFDVTGDELDVGKFVHGEPEDFMTLVPAEIEQEPKLLRVGVNFGASCGVDAEAMTRKGAAATGLIDILEQHGKRVELDAITIASSSRQAVHTIIRIKDFNGPVQLANLIFALAHPSAHRRLAFCSWEHLDEDVREAIGITPLGGYGRPRDLPMEEREQYDIYVPSLYGSWDRQAAVEYIIAELSKQGIYTEKEVP